MSIYGTMNRKNTNTVNNTNTDFVSEAAILTEDTIVVVEGYEESLVEAIIMGTYIEEKATFSFLPRFREKENYKELANTIEDAEDLLNSEGKSTETGLHKFGKIALRLLDLYYNVGSVISLISCVTIVGIIPHLISRLIEYAIQLGKHAVAESYTDKCIRKLTSLKKEVKDSKKEAQIQKQIDKLTEMKENLNKY